MTLIDSNIFLEVLLGRERYRECEELLERVKRGTEEAFMSRFSLYSIELLLARLRRFDALTIFLSTLSTFKGLSILTTSISDDRRIVQYMQKTGLDFDDALNYFIAKKHRLKASSASTKILTKQI